MLALAPLTVGEFAAERVEGELVTRLAENADRNQVRTLGYVSDASRAESRSASQWWDQRLDLGADGAIRAVRRDVLTWQPCRGRNVSAALRPGDWF